MTATLRYRDLVETGSISPPLVVARLAHSATRTPSGYTKMHDLVDGGVLDVFKGSEPGSQAYAMGRGAHVLIKTGALVQERLVARTSRTGCEFVQPYAFATQDLQRGDILVAKDGPVGRNAVLAWAEPCSVMIASGLMRLRFRNQPWFYAGILKHGPYTPQIERLTPSGATIKHASQELILSGLVPKPETDQDVADRLQLLTMILPHARSRSTEDSFKS